MKLLRLEIERCGQCPAYKPYFGSWGIGSGICAAAENRSDLHVYDDTPPSWCPLPEAAMKAASDTIGLLREALESLTTGECGDFLRARFPATLEHAEIVLKKVRGQ